VQAPRVGADMIGRAGALWSTSGIDTGPAGTDRCRPQRRRPRAAQTDRRGHDALEEGGGERARGLRGGTNAHGEVQAPGPIKLPPDRVAGATARSRPRCGRRPGRVDGPKGVAPTRARLARRWTLVVVQFDEPSLPAATQRGRLTGVTSFHAVHLSTSRPSICIM